VPLLHNVCRVVQRKQAEAECRDCHQEHETAEKLQTETLVFAFELPYSFRKMVSG
jgi:hypothetical protein